MYTHRSAHSKAVLTAVCALAIAFMSPWGVSKVFASDNVSPFDNLDSVALLDAVNEASPPVTPPASGYDQSLYGLDSESLVDAVDQAHPVIAPTPTAETMSLYNLDSTGLLDAVDGN